MTPVLCLILFKKEPHNQFGNPLRVIIGIHQSQILFYNVFRPFHLWLFAGEELVEIEPCMTIMVN